MICHIYHIVAFFSGLCKTGLDSWLTGAEGGVQAEQNTERQSFSCNHQLGVFTHFTIKSNCTIKATYRDLLQEPLSSYFLVVFLNTENEES